MGKIKRTDPFGGRPMPVESFVPRDTDISLTVRAGVPYLKTPQHDDKAKVPDDFIVMMGVAISFTDPAFRAMMRAVVRDRQESGSLENVISNGRGA